MPPLRACRGADAPYRSFGQQRGARGSGWTDRTRRGYEAAMAPDLP